VDKIVNKLIKSYFNLSPLYNNKKSSRVEVRFKRLSLNRILVSRAEMKHTNNKVIITVYLYNKNKKFFLYKLKNLYKTFLFRIGKKIPSLALNAGSAAQKNIFGDASHAKNTTNSNKVLKTKNNAYKTSATTTKKSLSKFSSKRFKKSNKISTRYGAIKTNYYINFTNLTKKNLSKFLFNLKNTALKNKYKTLISKYYFLLSNNTLNTINNKNYFLNYINLAKANSSVNSAKNLYTSNLYESNLKNTFFSTKRNNNSYNVSQSAALLDDSAHSVMREKKNLAFENVFALNKTRKPRNIKNFVYKLRNLHKLFFISKMYNLNKSNNVLNNSASHLAPAVKKSNFLLKNLHNILKNKSNLIRKINYISLKGLRILKKARKNKNFLLKTLK